MNTRPIAIVGAGMVGCGWAIVFARAGIPVRIHDPDDNARATTHSRISEMIGDHSQGLLNRITVTADLVEALDGVSHVQECVPEDVQLKAKTLERVARITTHDVVIASSTSGLMPSLFTANMQERSRALVAHPINPPHLHTAVELVPAPWTSATRLNLTHELLESVGMEPIQLSREIDGFVVNRLQGALLHEAFRLMASKVVSAADIDRAVRGALAPRWLILGAIGTIDLNAPGGIADYVKRYEPLYQRLAASNPPVDWARTLEEGILDEIEASEPRANLADRRTHRDQQLAALLKFREGTDLQKPCPEEQTDDH